MSGAATGLRLLRFLRLVGSLGLGAVKSPAVAELDRRRKSAFAMTPALAARYLEDGPAGLDDPARNWLRESVLRVQGAGPVLDAGCGPGHDLARLEERLDARLIGCDAAPEMLAVAKRRAPRTPLVLADLSGLPFEDRSFDVVFSRHTLEFVDDVAAALAELCRVTRRSLVLGCFAVRTSRHPLSFGNDAAGWSLDLDQLKEFWRAQQGWELLGHPLGNGRYGVVARRGSGDQSWEPPEPDRRWTPRDHSLRLLACVWRLFAVRLALRVVRPERVARWLPVGRAWEPREAETYVRIAAAALPWRPLCLEQSIVLASLIAPADIVLGAGRDTESWAMHAWVERDGLRLEPIPDPREMAELRRFRVEA